MAKIQQEREPENPEISRAVFFEWVDVVFSVWAVLTPFNVNAI
jgi:hypothetical protein